ncbi:hypothetical protein C8F01DRAFT_1237142 [Mycena amicta]|nr:hypothetical protein C8F01DRAFT_1237142 [Mycena amicta]
MNWIFHYAGIASNEPPAAHAACDSSLGFMLQCRQKDISKQAAHDSNQNERDIDSDAQGTNQLTINRAALYASSGRCIPELLDMRLEIEHREARVAANRPFRGVTRLEFDGSQDGVAVVEAQDSCIKTQYQYSQTQFPPSFIDSNPPRPTRPRPSNSSSPSCSSSPRPQARPSDRDSTPPAGGRRPAGARRGPSRARAARRARWSRCGRLRGGLRRWEGQWFGGKKGREKEKEVKVGGME